MSTVELHGQNLLRLSSSHMQAASAVHMQRQPATRATSLISCLNGVYAMVKQTAVCGMSERKKFPRSTAAIAVRDRPRGDCRGWCCAYANASSDIARFRPAPPTAAAGTFFCYGSYTSAASAAKPMATRYEYARSIAERFRTCGLKAKRPHAIIHQIVSYCISLHSAHSTFRGTCVFVPPYLTCY